ncbi:MAG: Nif3-like dinuclear metal center hexameric protein, partial [Actinomycetes bacterium]
MTHTLADVVGVLDRLYDPRGAEAWDAVGLVTGDLDQPVRRVMLAVDPVQRVIDEAVDWQADLLVTHHPLLLRPVHAIATSHPKGRAVTTLVRAGVALHVAHTNADVADPGVSDALAAVLGLADLQPLRPQPQEPTDKLVTFVPHDAATKVLDALAAAGAGRIGDYERCAWTTEGTGTFVPGGAAHPTVGQVGRTERVAETRLEMVLPRPARAAVVAALRASHPYEQPAFDLVPLAALPGRRGLGRVGRLPEPVSLAAFAERRDVSVVVLPDVFAAAHRDAYISAIA